MKITGIETLHCDQHPNTLWLRLHTSDGLIGLGETYYAPRAVAAIVHDVFANLLLYESVFDVERLWSAMFATVNFFGHAGAEMRAISAIDIALHDLIGQYLGRPICELIGGRTHDRLPIYNTCVSYGDCDDHGRWRHGSIEDLADELLATGTRAMKIWPFDQFGRMLESPIGRRAGAEAVGPATYRLSREDLDRGVDYVRRVRAHVGDRMAIAIEGHSRWDLTQAARIVEALAPYDVLWFEDMIQVTDADSLVALKRAAGSARICGSERLITRYAFKEPIARGAFDIVMPDIVWTGGLSETRRVAQLAELHHLPVTTHDTVGPVALHAAAHLMTTLPNALIMETVRGYCRGWYAELMTHPIVIEDGHVAVRDAPGLGTALRQEFLERGDLRREMTEERSDVVSRNG